VTFSGNFSPVSRRRRSVQIVKVSTTARRSRSISSSFIERVSFIGDIRARWRISSEYELPMPLNSRGSVSARLTVWFSRTSASRKTSMPASSGSMPPRSSDTSPSRPCSRCSDARRFDPASVRISVPVSKSNAARPNFPGTFAPGASQRKRPAIIRWIAIHASPSRPTTILFPIRATDSTTRPTRSEGDGETVRSRKGLASLIASRRRPTMRALSAST